MSGTLEPQDGIPQRAILISFSGLPGVSKTTIARSLARELGAVYLRVDTVEAALKNSSLRIHPAEDAGYRAIIAIACENLKNGLTVIADAVNPSQVTRDWFAKAARECNAVLLKVEVICSDTAEHMRRVEGRVRQGRDQMLDMDMPNWDQVCSRTFESWFENRVIVDTSRTSVADCVAQIVAALQS